MGEWFRENVLDSGRLPALLAIIAFIATFTITRGITLRIRARAANAPADAEPSKVKDVYIGGVHIHHQVWGILLILLVGVLLLRYQPDGFWLNVAGIAFGIGAALTLDEYALWLHLDDVYWSEEGRKSIDAVLIAAALAIALLLGASPVDWSSSTADELGVAVSLVIVALHLTYTSICLLKGKLVTGLLGFPIPIFGLVGSIRLAKPGSFWSQRFYSPEKKAKSAARFAVKERSLRERVEDLFFTK